MLNDFVGQKGDEMTEVVTSFAASQQLHLLAPRQQAFSVERQGVDSGFSIADLATTQAESAPQDLPQFSAKEDDQNPVNRHKEEAAPQPRPEPISGSSKPRIEIKHIDLGLTPSEVVGTPDILQRFDTNGDGRVDLIEAARAGTAREGVFTYAGIGGAKQVEETSEPIIVEQQQAPEALTQPGVPEAIVAPTGEKKFFRPSDIEATKKLHVATVAAQGVATGTVDAPRKFYGQGVEVVAGKFAVAETQPRFVAKDEEKTTVVLTEDGGETKIYDKVAQTETETPSGDTAEKGQPEASARKLVQVVAYDDASTITDAAEVVAQAVTA